MAAHHHPSIMLSPSPIAALNDTSKVTMPSVTRQISKDGFVTTVEPVPLPFKYFNRFPEVLNAMQPDFDELGLIILDTPLYSDTLGRFVDPSPGDQPLPFRCAKQELNIIQLPQYSGSAQPYAYVVAPHPTVNDGFVVALCPGQTSFNAADFFSRIHKLQEHYIECFDPNMSLMNAYRGYHNFFKTLPTYSNSHYMLEIPRNQPPNVPVSVQNLTLLSVLCPTVVAACLAIMPFFASQMWAEIPQNSFMLAHNLVGRPIV